MTEREALLRAFLARLHETGALSVPPADLEAAVRESLIRR